ncbi:MAG: neutral zinc metallopeptidase [Caldilineaceae bacterium]|nr:neutral zinc metallopeptidase [Caldilineaceae bacterium]
MDPSQVQDRRGGRPRTAVAVGGGGIGVVILVLVAMLFGVDPRALLGVIDQGPVISTQPAEGIENLAEVCQTGEDANTRQDCRIVGFVNSIQAFWDSEFARYGEQYPMAQTVLFSGATEGACGYASASMGPFYCPRDRLVYLDLGFFEELQVRYGAQGGPLAEAYVLAHEYGHHIQNLTGVLAQGSGSGATGPQSMAVQIELQADCLAGVWINHATETGYLTQITEEQIAQAMDAASAVGDDHIQRQAQGYVAPESWTHGSSAQRQQSLMVGLRSGDLASCEIR